jgi:hypothetical protein
MYYPLAWWLPIRIGFFGAIGFVISLLLALALALRQDERPRPRTRQTS